MPLPFDPMLAGYLVATGGPKAIAAHPNPWPHRIPRDIPQADYYIGQSGIYLETPFVGAAQVVVARTPLFCGHPEAGIDTRGAIPMRRRPGDQVEIHVGVLGITASLATSMVLELWGGETVARAERHWVRPALTVAAADALTGLYGIGTTLEAGPRFWFARLRFPDIVAVPAGNPLVQWFVSA